MITASETESRVIHYQDTSVPILCGASERDAGSTDLCSVVTCPVCRNVLHARQEFRRTVDRLIPYPRQ